MPRPVLQALLREAVVPIQLFVFSFSKAVQSACCPLPSAVLHLSLLSFSWALPGKSSLSEVWKSFCHRLGCTRTSAWRTSMKLKEVLHILQVSFFCPPWNKKSPHHVLCFKPRAVLKPLFCQGRTVQHMVQVCPVQDQDIWLGVPWWSLERDAGNKGDSDPQNSHLWSHHQMFVCMCPELNQALV